MNSLETYFQKFRKHIVGNDLEIVFETGKRKMVYADWAASGRLYKPIEDYISNKLGPYVANTHTETTLTGTIMTDAYQQAHRIIKKHVNASQEDQLLFVGFGMTAAINKFQRILGLRVPEKYKDLVKPSGKERPLVILTHMEHHSNQTTWVECLCEVKIMRRDHRGLPDLDHLTDILKKSRDRKFIIGAFTACSNVTGIITPYYKMAEIIHDYGGFCFIDFSASAPYVDINMHPDNPKQHLDAVFFSPHKFLGGPGSSGVLVFHKSLYNNKVPDQVGGGTVQWTNPWGEQRYFEDIEIREDGGTPGFLQAIKASLAILLKEYMGIKNILKQEHHLTQRLLNLISKSSAVQILEPNQLNRIGFISLYLPGIHHNLIVRILNDFYGIQTRGGCSCAGTYGHLLLNIDYHESHRIAHLIDLGDFSKKPGWVRISIHPTMAVKEVEFIADALEETIKHHTKWIQNYKFNHQTGEFLPKGGQVFKLDIREGFKTYCCE
jgi:selenocysteine lyase/cysteine desulfurase